jgi:hypothetical protein
VSSLVAAKGGRFPTTMFFEFRSNARGMIGLLSPLCAHEDAAAAFDAPALRRRALKIAFWVHCSSPFSGGTQQVRFSSEL